MERQLIGGDFQAAANHAHAARAGKEHSEHSVPPSGPKPEPVKLNGVPVMAEKGVSKKK